MNPSTPIDRAEINRQNASHSRGPVSAEGKRRVSLNALRHGLTGHTVVLPSEDLAAYQKHCGDFHTELKPQGLIETKCVQTIADTYWRLDRIRAMENSLFGLAVSERTGEALDQEPAEMSPDPLIDSGLAQAKSLEQHSDLLIRLSLYEHRLYRTLEKAKAELKELQKERAKSREKALEEAAEIAKFKKALHQPWDPHDSGFEFSAEDLTVWMRRIKLINQAEMYRRAGPHSAHPVGPERSAPQSRRPLNMKTPSANTTNVEQALNGKVQFRGELGTSATAIRPPGAATKPRPASRVHQLSSRPSRFFLLGKVQNGCD